MVAAVGMLARQDGSTEAAGVLAGLGHVLVDMWQLAGSIQKDASRSGRSKVLGAARQWGADAGRWSRRMDETQVAAASR